MDYELAKQLKAAGFKHDWCNSDPVDKVWCGAPDCLPTLEEFIEACGADFNSLKKFHDGWVAAYGEFDTYHNAPGANPTEAVARLWLALHTTE